MKNIFLTGLLQKVLSKMIILLFIPAVLVPLSASEPDIRLPQIEINIDDRKGFETDLIIIGTSSFQLDYEPILKPDLSEIIKIDLEKTLPERIENPQRVKPVDALIKFGYGLNNNLLVDFSIFIKNFNPLISINYSRIARDNYWFEERNRKVFYSLDNLNADITYTNNLFTINTAVGYTGSNYSLQNKSIYNTLDKKILSLDINPFIKFNSKNDLSLVLQNSFFFNNLTDSHEKTINFRNDFDYILKSDIIYSLVINNDNYLSLNTGYDFGFISTLSEGFSEYEKQIFNNQFKTGANYLGILKDSWLMNLDFTFRGYWKDEDFHWYILPQARFTYNLKDFMTTYIEGGAEYKDLPQKDWMVLNDHSVYPMDIIPGYNWFAKTGIKTSFAGYISAFTDIKFSYDKNGFAWNILSADENIYTLKQQEQYSLILSAGLNAAYRQLVKFTLKWDHEFLELKPFTAGDSLKTRVDLGIQQAGLSLYTEFEGLFRRVNHKNKGMNNIYLLNAGIDWNFQERFGVGADFRNIIYFQKHQYKTGYDEPGFEFTVYIKAGF